MYMVTHRQPAVDQHSKVVHRGLEGQCAASKSDRVDHNFLKLPRTAQPNELFLFGIELQSDDIHLSISEMQTVTLEIIESAFPDLPKMYSWPSSAYQCIPRP